VAGEGTAGVGAEREAPRLPPAGDASASAAERRREALAGAEISTRELAGTGEGIEPEALARSIEGFVGFARVPVGVFGPLLIRGAHAQGEFWVPIATSEGALVQSYQHVCNLLARADGIEARALDQGVQRGPGFTFPDLDSAARFAAWLSEQEGALAELAAAGSSYCRLKNLRCVVIGDAVYVQLTYSTGDAAGQNMVTAAAQAACTWVLERTPVRPEHWLLEANWSGDKKASHLALQGVRGRKATAVAILPDKLCRRYFRGSAAAFVKGWDLATSGAILSGTIGCQGNVANALAGLFIACGQDVACVSEASVAITRMRLTESGDALISTTLPNLIVGTVGGGTYLPTARECLAMLGCEGAGRADKLAEICAAVALCGEIALAGALTGGSFAEAHAAVGRKREG
jgi:hydroxymethylglutaryl-CoA reductase (NADPH)